MQILISLHCICFRSGFYGALKIVKSASNYTEAALDETKLLLRVSQAPGGSEGRHCVVEMFDHFEVNGPHGRHVCMVFEVLGPNLLRLIKDYKYEGLPVPVVRRISRQILLGLDRLHRECGIIHTDIKPENVLIGLTAAEITELVQGPNSDGAVETQIRLSTAEDSHEASSAFVIRFLLVSKT